MKITQETTEPISYCVIDLERDFETNQQAVEFILTSDLLSNPAILNELSKSSRPQIRIKYTICGTYSLFYISMH